MDVNEIENFTEATLRKSLANFERRHSDNQKARIKYADEPRKIAPSETELFASLDEIQGVAVQPELYPVLMERKSTLSTLLSLLTHENSDVSAKVVKIISDFVEYDSEDTVGGEQVVGRLVKVLLDLNLIDLLLSNVERLHIGVCGEEECIRDTLEIFENILEQDPVAISRSSRKMIEWMVNELKVGHNYNRAKFEISDLLTILVSSTDENKVYLCEANGIDILLQLVSKYRKVSPVGGEQEFLAQIFNCLSVAVLDCEQAKVSFLEEEGVDLVELILREKDDAVKRSNIKMSILQLFSYVVSTDKNEDPIVTKCCERFVEVLGLRVIFPIFNNPKFILNRRLLKSEYRSFLAAAEEHTSSIIMAMLKYTQNEEYIQRILIKFADSNFEKFERALSLHDKYFEIVQTLDRDDTDQRISLAFNNLKSIDYIILLVVYLSQHFETYDPIGGETFSNYLRKTFKSKSYMRHQITTEVSKHIKEVENSPEEQKSLSFLLGKFQETFDAIN
uniref:Beta-catenin-like protein 1 n=1 Tax=Aceria tosichella TaxID=561515 RepID=A0A6G1SB11_9ACAR